MLQGGIANERMRELSGKKEQGQKSRRVDRRRHLALPHTSVSMAARFSCRRRTLTSNTTKLDQQWTQLQWSDGIEGRLSTACFRVLTGA